MLEKKNANRHLSPSYIQAWIMASRPRTLPVSFVPVLVGSGLASSLVTALNWTLICMVLASSLWIQIGTNLINDALDFKKGADGDDRLGPLRATQAGLLPLKHVLLGGYLCFGLALICGIPLILAGGWPFTLILILSFLCGYLYTGGPYPLAYIGFSDLFILIFFGWVSTCAVFYLQTGMITLPCFLAATQIGLLAMVPHAINNLRDRASDAKAGKKTLSVRFGAHFSRLEISFLSFFPFLLGLGWLALDSVWMAFFPFCVLPPLYQNVISLWKAEPSPLYNRFLAKSVECQLEFGCLLVMGHWLGRYY